MHDRGQKPIKTVVSALVCQTSSKEAYLYVNPNDILYVLKYFDEDFHCLQSIHPISSTTSIIIYTSSRYDCNNVSVIFTCICPCYSGISPL